ncbi:gp350 [macacine gammaherpesvirus 10]|uniref:Gp350 n=1 Tax=macacine gammaherpesvirus 10 TaxID=2560569 RepID=A0A0S0DIJ7_9GAMA|nr:gp350 [macacine gammaherpesvirus 10]ALF03230.1 gp350 [macacine gammaherpesvirus 10]
MEAAFLLCHYTLQSVFHFAGEDPGFFNIEMLQFPFYPNCEVCTADVNISIVFKVGEANRHLDLNFGPITPTTQNIYQPLDASGGIENVTSLFFLELLGARTMALTMRSIIFPINVSMDEEHISMEAIYVYFLDVFNILWCQHVQMKEPVYLIPKKMPPVVWDHCNSTNITAVVRAQGMDISVPISLPTMPMATKFSLHLEMTSEGIDMLCRNEGDVISPVLPGNNNFAIKCDGDKPHFASAGVLAPASPSTTPAPIGGYIYNLSLMPRPVPRFLGNASTLYIMYSEDPDSEHGDFCLKAPIMFSDKLPTAQDMPAPTEAVMYTGQNATYQLQPAPSENNTAPNVTVTAFWAWANDTSKDFKCKWMLHTNNQQPEGCERMTGHFLSNRTFELTVEVDNITSKTLIISRAATNVTAVAYQVTFTKAPDPVTSAPTKRPEDTTLTTPTGMTSPNATSPTSASTTPNATSPTSASTTPNATSPTSASTTPNATSPTSVAPGSTSVATSPSSVATSPNATGSSSAVTSPSPASISPTPEATGPPSVITNATHPSSLGSSSSPGSTSPPRTSSTPRVNSTSVTPPLTSTHETGSKNITETAPETPNTNHVSTGVPTPPPRTTGQTTGPGNSSTSPEPGSTKVTTIPPAQNATSPSATSSQKTTVPTGTPAGGKANVTTEPGSGGSTKLPTDGGNATTPTSNATTPLPPTTSSTLRPRWTSTGPPATTTQATVPVPPTVKPEGSNLSMLVLQWASLGVLTLLLLLVISDCAFRRSSSRIHTYTHPPYDDDLETAV